MRQGMTVAPTVDLLRSKIYQLAEHSNLFVLSLADGEALQTVYLGHEQGNVTAPPVIVSRYLVLAENDRAEGGTLRVLSLEAADEASPVAPLQEVAVNGYVDTSPLVLGARVVVVTDKGDIYVFEISASNAEAPLAELAKGKAAEGGLGLPGAPASRLLSIRYPLMIGSQIWIADSQLSRFGLQPSKARVEPKGIENEGSMTMQPPVPVGNTVVHVRRKIGLPGVLVSAMPMEGGRALWETHLAAPLVTEPSVDQEAGRITAVSAIGAVYRLTAAEVQGRPVFDEPAVALPPTDVRRPVTKLVSLEGGLLVLAIPDGPTQMPAIDLQKPDAFRWFALPGPLGCPPVGLSGGLLAPCQLGQAVLLDPGSGRQQMEPFQPRLESGVELRWRSAASTASGEAILADDRNRLYRIGVKQEPTPHLAQLAAVDLAEPIISPLAVLEPVVYAVDAANTLLAFELPGLTRGQMLPLGGRCVWGPRRVGDRVLVATDEDRLCCLGADQAVLWRIELPYGPLAGAPLAIDGEYLLAAASGVLWRIDAATGESAAKPFETGCPLATGPVLLGDRILVGGYDGTLYEFEKP